jgi:hypothetical protein
MTTIRRVGLVLGMTSTIAIGMAMWAWGERAATQAKAAAASAAAPQPVQRPANPVTPVHVERTLVRVTHEVVERPVRAERARVQPRSEIRLVARARRMLFGSGRYRPEPFPRAERQDLPAR